MCVSFAFYFILSNKLDHSRWGCTVLLLWYVFHRLEYLVGFVFHTDYFSNDQSCNLVDLLEVNIMQAG